MEQVSELELLRRRVTELEATVESFTLSNSDGSNPAVHRRVLESMTEGVSVADKSGYIVFTNAAEDRMFGYEAGELIGQHVMVQNAYLPDDNAKRVAEVIEQLNRTGSFSGEWESRRKDGTEFRTSTRITAMEWGGHRYFVCVQRDLTDSRRAEQQLTDILETVNESFIALDRDWRVTYANRRVLSRIGKTREQVIGQSVWDVAPDAVGTEFLPQYQRVMEDRTPARFEVSYPNGTYLDVRAYPTEEGLSAHILDITEFKKAQRGMRELAAVAGWQRRQLQAIVDNLEQAVMVFDREGQMTLANPAAARLHGYRSAKEMPQSIDDFRTAFSRSTPDGRALAPHEWPVARALRGERVVNAEILLSRLDTGKSWIGNYQASPVRDEHGNVLQAIVTIYDLTDRVRAEMRLRDAAERLRLALSASRMGDWSWDVATDRIALSEAAAGVIGWPPEMAITWTAMRARLHPDDQERARIAVEEALAKNADYDIEYRIDVDDHWRWVAASGRGVYARDGAVTGMLGVLQDISGRKQAEAALRESEERFRTMANHAPVLVWISGSDKRYTWFNQAWLEFTGRTVEQERGDGWLAGIHPDDFARCVTVYNSAFDAREEFQVEYRLRRHGGEYRWLLNHGVPLISPSGEFSGYIGSCVDITGRMLADRAMREANEALRIANADLEQFAFAAAHDLQEPLRMVTSYTQLLARRFPQGGDPQTEEYMDQVVSASKRMSLLLHDLLAYTETARQSAEPPEHVDLNVVLAEVLTDLRTKLDEVGGRVEHDILPCVPGRHGNYVQLLQNLIGNAIKYRKEHVEPLIRIACTQQEGEYLVSVEDNGIGIQPEYHRQIFGVFKRLHGRAIPGTGIGLAICQRVVEKAGGRIWVESESGHGAAFRFTIPVK